MPAILDLDPSAHNAHFIPGARMHLVQEVRQVGADTALAPPYPGWIRLPSVASFPQGVLFIPYIVNTDSKKTRPRGTRGTSGCAQASSPLPSRYTWLHPGFFRRSRRDGSSEPSRF